MAVDKYLANGADGLPVEVEFTVVSAGEANAGEGVGLDNTGRLSSTVMPVGVGPVSTSITAYEDIAAGLYVNIFQHAGVAKIRKADNSDPTKNADGFIAEDVLANASAVMYLPGNVNSNLVGLDPGKRYFLASSGAVTSDPTTIPAGGIYQPLGKSLSATEMIFDNSQFREKHS